MNRTIIKLLLLITLLPKFSLAFALLTSRVDSLLTCQIFANGMPKGMLEMPINGETANQVSKSIETKSGEFRAEISWGGLYEDTPLNPEIRIQYLNVAAQNIVVESYKNVDLQRIEKSNDCCEVDNVGLKTMDDVIYLSCTYQKK